MKTTAFIFTQQQERGVGRTIPVSCGSAGTPRPALLARFGRISGAASALMLLAGCSSLLPIQPAQVDATHYYTLTAPAAPTASPTSSANAPKLMILRVEVPAYLQHRPFVTRLGPNEVKLIDDVRWAEPLDLGIAQALRERLAQLTGVHGMDSREMARDYEVVVHVLHCEGEAVDGRGTVRFAADVDLIRPGAKTVVAHRAFTAAPAAWDGRDYAALAQALSGSVAELAEAIVAAVPGK